MSKVEKGCTIGAACEVGDEMWRVELTYNGTRVAFVYGATRKVAELRARIVSSALWGN